GDLPQDDAVKAECRARGIAVLHCEMAWFPQIDTVYFDWDGVNGASSILRAPLPRLTAGRRRELESFLACYHALMADAPPPPDFPRDFILAPLQVETDSSLVRYSPVSCMSEFVGMAREVFPGETIVVRRHPKSPSAPASLPPGCVYAGPEIGLHQLLARSKAVAALNSTVVLEALTYYKPVVAFGRGLFSGRGVVLDASAAVPAEMRRFAGAPLDAGRRDAIAGLLYELIFNRTFYNRDLGDPVKVGSARFYRQMLRLPSRRARSSARVAARGDEDAGPDHDGRERG
ncbi:MAG: hypothetical protein NUW21_16260, partial [Elusimicrobia bacterium]|nr:hypothetical protein [Elusimicrobiota bacterium]